MTKVTRAAKLLRTACLVDRLSTTLDSNPLPKAERDAARAQIGALRGLLAGHDDAGALALSQALGRLSEMLARIERLPRARRRDPVRGRRFVRSLRRIAAIVAAGAILAMPLAAAAAVVLNPDTGLNETIVEQISPSVVRTDQGNFILIETTVGNSFTDPDTAAVYTVTAVTTNGLGNVTSVTVVDSASVSSTVNVVTDQAAAIAAAAAAGSPGAPGSGTGTFTFPAAVGDVNNFVDSKVGNNGGDGSDGFGVKICVPYIGCATIAKSPSRGGDGQDGPTINDTITGVYGNITTVSANLPGIVVSSVGGNGGQGGDAYGNIPAASGGKAGRGGDVTIASSVTIITTGDNSAGIFAQSRSGHGGAGGTGYIASAGGGGGTAGQSGDVNATNTGQISTAGDGAMGILAQSLGGAAGHGGDSYGIIGEGGGGTVGGNGGAVTVIQGGIVQTSGDDAHGVLAQSIGGSGGNAGTSGGIVTFGDAGAAGGEGGSALIVALSGSSTSTSGDGSDGLFAQSIGGGGGNGGTSIGAVTLGSGGGAGGSGGQAKVKVESGASVSTTGDDAHAVFAQSVGGGGGSAGVSGGLVALGASGEAGGGGGTVRIISGGIISTSGTDSRGLFAQSVGGGGGAASGTGGLVALGGSGAGGGAGGSVTIGNKSGGSVITQGDGADAVFAQSVGGGGGSGSSSGGVVALGGSGGGGGAGGIVRVTNDGLVVTGGMQARGVFAQSVGGGGGSGGDGGGLATIGGSGGAASLGGDVTVNNSGSISTRGNQSNGIQAQSIGGGGGDGGSTGGVFLTVGGSGTAGGGSGLVTVNDSGDIFTGETVAGITTGNDADGIFAQSVGGGGGNGGSSHGLSAFAGAAIGGAGGIGGDGGVVDVNLTQRSIGAGAGLHLVDPLIVTHGDRARGVFAQSVGGGGGNGGSASIVSVGYGPAAGVAIGGSGGDGGVGGVVNLTGDATILTQGDYAVGIQAQSVGGGGGNGGYAAAFTFAVGETAAGAFNASVGGSGGGGGVGGLVNLQSGGSLQTLGDFSTGLLAQSVGGGGGSGGFSLSFSTALSGAGSAAAAAGIGGSGGTGGAGGEVHASFDGTISTSGDDALGALIQSVGGGGGSGGFSITGAVAISGGGAGAAAVGIGGHGGGGGAGGSVNGLVTGAVQTTGDRSTGVVIQSVGGGGGSGGYAIAGAIGGGGTFGGAVSVGVGGSGGGGGVGGDVIGGSTGTILTTGAQSGGLLVQSVGGGGGAGGYTVSGSVGAGGSAGAAVAMGVGGAGGTGGRAGSVQANAFGTVITEGDQSTGVTVQSVGGGGGAGGYNISGSFGISGGVGAAAAVGVGGAGGGGGAGGAVDASAHSILTFGDQSDGFLAQSVGGGGGKGAFNISGSLGGGADVGAAVSIGVGGAGGDGGNGGLVGASVNGDVTTLGAQATAIVAQSVGGGGGKGGFNVSGAIGGGGGAGGAVSLGVGGAGGGGGSGGDVTLNVTGLAQTAGTGSGAILEQSVGGGGGNAAFAVAASVGLSLGGGAGAVGIGVGGQGGGGGNAGGVTLRVNQGVADPDNTLVAAQTVGDGARAIVAQSIGGGGGNGGVAVGGAISAASGGAGSVGIGVGGGGGGGGTGNAVSGLVAGDVMTEGADATGVLIQSVGGGGGAAGFGMGGAVSLSGSGAGAVSVGIGGSGGGGGGGGLVAATIAGDVTTQGDRSDGVIAQSIGGGGGLGGVAAAGGISASGLAGAVSVGLGGSGGGGGSSAGVSLAVIGTTETAGAQSGAILAQSVGGGGGKAGFSIAGGIAIGAEGAGTASVSVGGQGGGGGSAGSVTLQVNNGVADPGNTLIAALTTGDGARAVVAQSIGGGGGAGGFSVAGGISIGQQGAGNIGVGIGGAGGGGGDGGAASGSVTGDVMTSGDDASGVLVQSVGGGGGAGGYNITGGLAASKSVAGNLLFGMGGSGGGGGDGGAVSGGVTGDIVTEGNRAAGATYQSIGGGGGAGGFNVTAGVSLALTGGGAGNVGAGVGGFGGDGGDGSTVNATLIGDITTSGVSAHGALLQSVGGGGGAGGMNITGGLSASGGTNGVLGFGLGGFGGGGGNAGGVTGVLSGDVTTAGDGAFGATLQSLGGGGGVGGMNITGAASLSVGANAAVSIGIGVGGFGGGGGDSGDVTGTVTGVYRTSGDRATGVIAQSLGGGGGAGGMDIAGSVAIGAGSGSAVAVSMGLGGFGGSGGSSGDVNLTRVGDTFTTGASTDAIIAQSLAGGGGAGGMNITGGISASLNSNAASIGLGIGGFGGDGGTSGDVTAHITGNVLAQGIGSDVTTPAYTTVYDAGLFPITVVTPAVRHRLDGSNGVIAQSVGGGGGAGGINITGQIAISNPGWSSTSRVLALGIGGFGGSGGDAGAVDLTIDAPGADAVQVSAVGDDRNAVLAQSVGGGGGMGGINISGGVALDGQLTAGIGGFGGAGGLGGAVTADVEADLFASGDRAHGLIAQSIGGGGGVGGINISGGVTPDTGATEPSIVFGLGGFGGAGNRSSDVDVTQTGQVMVDGINSIGVLVQSIAGGGGSGGMNISADVTLGGSGASKDGYGIAAGVGGTGGDGADAGDVSLTSVGDIIINGKLRADPAPGQDPLEAVQFKGGSTGVLVQSIGGGGGVGGIDIAAAIAPFGNPVAIGVGGSGGSGGNAGAVTVTRGYTDVGGAPTATPGLIRTFGDKSDGLLAQSVGGGGGDAGMNFVFAAIKGGAGTHENAALIVVGGGGGGAGSASTVDVMHNGDIVTDGASSSGLVAQSVGGGGGNASFNIGFGVFSEANVLDLAVGGAPGAAGTGSDVTIDHVGTIVTGGDSAIGILGQSLGGGGGNTAMSMALGILARNDVTVSIGRRGGSGGAAGDVSISADGDVDTTGDFATGIMAQSTGGGGGISSATTVGADHTSGEGPTAEAYTTSLSIGIDGGVGAVGGKATVDVKGTVTTRGDDARGVYAQSLGGGGGVGGTAGAVVLKNAGAANVSIGGAGGTGARSDEVKVTTAATIVTLGDRSDGVLAQSIGGGGGLGGTARTIALQFGAPPSSTANTSEVNVGGNGGTGAVAGAVEVVNTGEIFTGVTNDDGVTGESSFGIRAQSIGGGGGIGGSVLNFRLQVKGDNNNFDVNVGGSGGTGGTGGDVMVRNEGLIVTQGRNAAGISANSIGGGGGDGGLVLDLVGGGGAGTSNRFVLNIGGSGGTGGTAGAVTVVNHDTGGDRSGVIVTKGAGAYGIFAQSLGGGGGNGSSIVSLTGLTGTNGYVGGLSVGGVGGSGNTGGLVTVSSDGLIDTSGDGAHGILAQSIGGGGGNGGMAIAASLAIKSPTNNPLVALGGFGGDGGDGGNVVVTNAGEIVTRGKNADGIVAQSIGGGGGDANMGFSLSDDQADLVLSNLAAAVVGGLGGGHGGAGGLVTVNHSGDITVLGEGSVGIRAESINGGGGGLTLDFDGIVGRSGVSYVSADGDAMTPDPIIVAKLGGLDVSDMNAGKVTVNSTGTFGAAGDNGVGDFGQSIGGGGGSANLKVVVVTPASDLVTTQSYQPASAGTPLQVSQTLGGQGGQDNNGGDVASDHTGAIVADGQNTPGLLIQTIGGGGGRAVIDVTLPEGGELDPITLILGATGETNAAGGDLSRTQAGVVQTTGDQAPGAILQSIGGGGGAATIDVHGAVSPAQAQAPVRQSAGYSPASIPGDPAAVASLGANGGSGLDGGTVSATFSGGLQTWGDHAPALVAQSIGGGGGLVLASSATAVDATLGGTGGATGNGAAVALTNDGDIVTSGVGSHGVFLQSIGGGGGAVFGGDGGASVTLRNANAGDGGSIAFSQTGDIVATGDGAWGLVAQSLGGGGGWVDGAFAGAAGGAGHGGAVTLTTTGKVVANGAGSTAVLAQSQGDAGSVNGDITLVLGDLVYGGSGAGMGLMIDGGHTNAATLNGLVLAKSNLAIKATGGDDAIDAFGGVIGNVDLGLGANSFYNHRASTFAMADYALLNGGRLTNDGVVSPGDIGHVQVTQVGGDYVQTQPATFITDLDLHRTGQSGEIDRLNVSGLANLQGKFVLNFDNPGYALPGDHTVTIIDATGPLTTSDLVLEKPVSAIASFDLQTTAHDLNLHYGIDFSPAGLNANQTLLGEGINALQLAGGSEGFAPIAAALFGVPNVGQLASIFDSFSPESYADQAAVLTFASQVFADSMMSCPNASGVVSFPENGCVWAKPEARWLTLKGNSANQQFRESSVGVSGGWEASVKDTGWRLGGALSAEHADSTILYRTTSGGWRFQGGFDVKKSIDRLTLAVAVHGGTSSLDTRRTVLLPSGPLTAQGNQTIRYLGVTARASYRYGSDSAYAKPMLEFSHLNVNQLGFTETGAGGANLKIPNQNGDFNRISAKLEVGSEVASGGAALRPYARVGVSYLASGDKDLYAAAFAAAPSGAQGFTVLPGLDRVTLDSEAGLAIVGPTASARLGWSGQFGERTHSQMIALKFTKAF